MIYLSNKKEPSKIYNIQKNLIGNYYLNLLNSNIKIDKYYYIGRPSILGNIFSHLNESLAEFKCETREESINSFEEWLDKLTLDSPQWKLINQIKKEYKIKNICLECWCCPKNCHGIIIIKKILND